MKKQMALILCILSPLAYSSLNFNYPIPQPDIITDDWDGDGLKNHEDPDDDNDGINDNEDENPFSREAFAGKTGGSEPKDNTQEPLPEGAILTFTKSVTHIQVGESATLAWTVENARELTLTGGELSGEIDVTSLTSYEITPTEDSVYTLNINDGQDTAQMGINVYLPSPIFYSFNASSMNVEKGDEVTFNWSGDNLEHYDLKMVYFYQTENVDHEIDVTGKTSHTMVIEDSGNFKLFIGNNNYGNLNLTAVEPTPDALFTANASTGLAGGTVSGYAEIRNEDPRFAEKAYYAEYGVNDNIKWPAISGLESLTDWTLDFMVRPVSGYTLSFGDFGNDWSLGVYGNQIWASKANVTSPGSSFNLGGRLIHGQWNHVALVVKDNNLRIFINGQIVFEIYGYYNDPNNKLTNKAGFSFMLGALSNKNNNSMPTYSGSGFANNLRLTPAALWWDSPFQFPFQ